MAKIDLVIPVLGNKFVDLRDTIPGDSFNWSWVRPLSQVNYLAIHHSATSDTQTPFEIANLHILGNGWGGIGYHFVISKVGIVYYVGDISTARANVANLNEEVIGICLVGNFTDSMPSDEQINSTRLLCEFFINNFPTLPNINSWNTLMGHNELPGQSTPCPGTTWDFWKTKITSKEDISVSEGETEETQVIDAYRKILGRDPETGILQTYKSSSLSIDQIRFALVLSQEHQELINLAKEAPSLKSQILSLQSSLALVNDQFINLQQKIADKDQEEKNLNVAKRDTSLTIFQAILNLYKFVFMPGKAGP